MFNSFVSQILLNPKTIHYLAAAISVTFSGIGVALGLAKAVSGTIDGFVRQGSAVQELSKIWWTGIAFIEGSFIFSFIVSIAILLAPPYENLTMPIAIAELGMALAMGVCSAFVGLAGGFAVHGGSKAAARQPIFVNKIQMLTAGIQTLMETPIVFSFIVAFTIQMKLTETMSLASGFRMLAAGLTIGFGSIGPSIGQLIFSKDCCYAPGINRKNYSKILLFSVLTEAFIETPILFSFIVSIFLLFKKIILAQALVIPILLSVAFVMSLGTIGASIGIGIVGSNAVMQIASESNNYPQILKTSLICQVLIETACLFSFVIALSMVIKATTL